MDVLHKPYAEITLCITQIHKYYAAVTAAVKGGCSSQLYSTMTVLVSPGHTTRAPPMLHKVSIQIMPNIAKKYANITQIFHVKYGGTKITM